MRTFLLLVAAVGAGLVGCEKRAVSDAEEQRRQEQKAADERRITELRELEQRAADRKAEEEVADLERQRNELAAERAKLEQERAQMEDAQARAVADVRLAKIREEERRNAEREAQRKAEVRRLAEERAAQNAERQRVAEQTIDFFYDALEPHGDWVEVDRYGYCWQPRGASNPAWRPYVAGNWARTDYGWTWVSREPFGWATYHYGRWIRVRRLGWVWVPGSEWAPAWVSWRRGDRYVGWAPLPPEARSSRGFTAAVDRDYDIGPANYTFVSTDALADDTYEGKVLAPERNITVIQQTVNVTNITVKNVQNRTMIYNEGPRLADQGMANKVRRLQVERLEQRDKASAPAEQRGNVLQVVAPVVVPRDQKPGRPPAKVREHVQALEVERGWTGTDAGKVAEVKEQQKKEAREAEQSGRPGQPPASTSAPEPKPVTSAPKEDSRTPGALPAETPRPPAPPKSPAGSTGPATTPKPVEPAAPVTPVAPAKPEGRPAPKDPTPQTDRPAETPPSKPARPDRPQRPAAPAEVPKNEGGKGMPVRERSHEDRSEAPAGGLRKQLPAATKPEDRKPVQAAPTVNPVPVNPPAPAQDPAANAKPAKGGVERPGASDPASPARPGPSEAKEKAEKTQTERNRDRERNRPARAPQPGAEENPATSQSPNPAAASVPVPASATPSAPALPKAPGSEKSDAGQTNATGPGATEKEDPSKVSNRTQKDKASKEKPE